jgi:hypothetical protein
MGYGMIRLSVSEGSDHMISDVIRSGFRPKGIRQKPGRIRSPGKMKFSDMLCSERLKQDFLTYSMLRYYPTLHYFVRLSSQTSNEIVDVWARKKRTFECIKYFLWEENGLVKVNPFKVVCFKKNIFFNAFKCTPATHKNIDLFVPFLSKKSLSFVRIFIIVMLFYIKVGMS